IIRLAAARSAEHDRWTGDVVVGDGRAAGCGGRRGVAGAVGVVVGRRDVDLEVAETEGVEVQAPRRVGEVRGGVDRRAVLRDDDGNRAQAGRIADRPGEVLRLAVILRAGRAAEDDARAGGVVVDDGGRAGSVRAVADRVARRHGDLECAQAL